jgi:hypothetical protein
LKKGIFSFELNGNEVLGFDTGLNPRDFARAKIAESIFLPGYIVYPDGNVGVWQSGGVSPYSHESAETMVIWGPLFPGEILTDLVKSNNKDEALNALRFWLKARIVLENKNTGIGNGAFIITKKNDLFPYGTVFFPATVFYERSLEAEEDMVRLDNERYKHPDLDEYQGISFCTGAMLYRIFCGVDAFTDDNMDDLRRNIREAVFIPPNLALPAIDPEMSELICRLLGKKIKGALAKRPAPNEIIEFIGATASRKISSWLRTLDTNALAKITAEKARYIKKTALTVKTKRFVARNRIIIFASIAVIVFIGLIIRDLVQSRSGDITKGMNPIEVAMTYYNAFGELDHAVMENCVIGKAGKEDIDMALNLFVISRVRQAYEIYSDSFIPAQRWIDEGSLETDKIVFGITNLKIGGFSMDEEKANLTAEYILWMPNYNEGENSSIPESNACIDELNFTFYKGAWRISNIRRIRQLPGSP